MTSTSIPVIDILPLVNLAADPTPTKSIPDEAQNVALQIAEACQTVGFFAITNHGVDHFVVNDALSAARDFFSLDSTIKSAVSMTETYPYGYENYESLGIHCARNDDDHSSSGSNNVLCRGNKNKNSNAISATTPQKLAPDSKETFSIGPINPLKSKMPPRQFPPFASPSFAFHLSKYFEVMEQLAQILFRGLALALQLEDPEWFLREGVFDEGHQCALRILNYPLLQLELGDEDVNEVDVQRDPIIRAGAHTDYGAFTILKSGGPGLQLQLSGGTSGKGKGGEWINVPHLPDAFVINLGDLMQRWTNDRWRSTLHRVVAVFDEAENKDGITKAGMKTTETTNVEDNKKKKVHQSAQRQSIAFFVNMNGDAKIVPFSTCVDEKHPSRYDEILASKYLIQRHAQSMGQTTK
mmetsp:Transcript_11303/g.24175  ORF Transcript_11303/g.24175 Transcript_11303/m.24175 type:complete len:410 (-) Transcript_11303:65-1294(-)|eukprot:CAMPEP_0171383242 /NCGR_PEP_ID=MMETSP0879-20121228/36012_1 /TAXON_ID=67004 /ORGANISM="Thalassiosira weissflogii, Strain CCMP1336" /LENGTH=409 /DNA_ID=CAMNT_0011895217 /DNA_START=29 /DNA_END=1258 /DNA_ORIENTATION=+